MEVEVGLIDQQHGLRRAMGNFNQLRARGDGAGRAVGIGDGDDLGARGDGREQALAGEFEVAGSLDRDHARGGHRRIDLVHGVSGHGQQEFVAVFEKGLEEHVNGFVDAVGERDLRGQKAEMSGNDGLDRLTLRIAREAAGGDFAQHLTHLGRAGQRVLVEVQAERVAAAERRVIFLHALHAQARRGADCFCSFSHGASLLCSFAFCSFALCPFVAQAASAAPQA